MWLSRRSPFLLSASLLFLVFFVLGFILDGSAFIAFITGLGKVHDPPLWPAGNPFLPKDVALEDIPQVQDDKVFGVFSGILVVSRPGRFDRRATMERLRLALGVPWTYVDAASYDDPVVKSIMDCVISVRRSSHSSTFRWPLNWMSDGSVLEASKKFSLRSQPTDLSCFPPPANAPPSEFSSVYAAAVEVPIADVQTAEGMRMAFPSSPTEPMTCAEDEHIHGIKFRPSMRSHMLLTSEKVACWYSHITAIQDIANTARHSSSPGNVSTPHQEAYLILEDDVDMEQAIARGVADVWSMLPSDWDMVYLGHCWSDESTHPAVTGDSKFSETQKVHLHPSYYPKCTHAYALNPASAHRLLRYLQYPPFAYSRALDQALAWLISSKRLKAFSIVPSLVIQLKTSGSDIDPGTSGVGSGWKDHLEHGVLGL
ncbi:hypothetical protein C8Q79DRAFT_932983 [Trametes meyenii]|nr:hypothetical protein C8Q79DRAFT_932983 [Trametes meyenii]